MFVICEIVTCCVVGFTLMCWFGCWWVWFVLVVCWFGGWLTWCLWTALLFSLVLLMWFRFRLAMSFRCFDRFGGG